MKQVLQSLKTGQTQVAEVPCPAVKRGQVLIHSSRTLVSAGTERMLVNFGKANVVEKARQQPDKARQVLEKMRTDGLMPTIDAVRNKLDQPLPLGYCNVGTVLQTGPGVSGIKVGDRVVSNGRHAEAVSVPVNLCANVPVGVPDDEAAFTVLGAIALQGVRLVQPTLGEAVVVTGLGPIGLVTVQLLRAHGCRVLGLDFDEDKLALAQQFGAEVVDLSAGVDPVEAAVSFSRGRCADAVIITASTKSNEPIRQAALMCRKRGRIVLVGLTGLELSRADFYEKELTFQVSCSYGPGRYDPSYEEKGNDYPIGYVRWTEQRNFEAVLDMMADGRLDVKPLVSHRFGINDAARAYELVSGATPTLGILLEYPSPCAGTDAQLRLQTIKLRPYERPSVQEKTQTDAATSVAFIGSGNYATAVLIPAFKAAGAHLQTIASSGGVSGVHAARKFGFEETTTDTENIFADPQIDTVVICTRHNTHARFVCQALAAGKHVFVEKPAALTHVEIDEIEAAYTAALAAGRTPKVMVGFNRRFAPHIVRVKQLLDSHPGPKSMIMTVNAGAIPPDHWTQDMEIGGGRIIGEGCHFVDLLRCLAGVPIVSHQLHMMASETGDTATITLSFADGSVGTVHYFANGNKAFPKERLEVFAAGRILQLDNFRKLKGFGWKNFQKMNLWRQDKGQRACVASFVESIARGGPAPISFEEIIEVSRRTIDLSNSAAT